MVTLPSLVIFYFILSVNGEKCQKSQGIRQSPININTLKVVYSWAPSLKWSYGYALTPKVAYINNTGRSFSLNVEHVAPLQISSGVLEVPYTFKELHFHWGNRNDVGSEHTINSFTYPIEMHAVHSQNISKNVDEIVVVAYFFKISSSPNLSLQTLLDKILESGQARLANLEITPFALDQLLLQKFPYLTYQGSLTTPPYTESVTWIISTEQLPISESQLDVFREASKIDRGLRHNFRCIQDSNFRFVRFIPEESLYHQFAKR